MSQEISKQLDLFYDADLSNKMMHWPNDFDGAHQVGGVDAQKQKIYESPDNGKTIFARDFGADPSTRELISGE